MTEEHRGDVVDLLLDQHRAIRQLCEEVAEATVADREEPFRALLRLLAVHEAVEEELVHPYVKRRVEGARETYASVLTSENNRDIYAQLVIAELGAMQNKMVDAAAMQKGLGEAGHIALYGAIVSFAFAGVMLVLSILGLVHLRQTAPESQLEMPHLHHKALAT